MEESYNAWTLKMKSECMQLMAQWEDGECTNASDNNKCETHFGFKAMFHIHRISWVNSMKTHRNQFPKVPKGNFGSSDFSAANCSKSCLWSRSKLRAWNPFWLFLSIQAVNFERLDFKKSFHHKLVEESDLPINGIRGILESLAQIQEAFLSRQLLIRIWNDSVLLRNFWKFVPMWNQWPNRSI